MGCASSKSSAADARGVDVRIEGGVQCEAIFFPDPCMPCRSYLQGGALCRRPNCSFAHEETSLVKLLRVLQRATRTLDVAVFTITCNEIADALEAAAQRGVTVRIISDDEQAKSKGSDVARLAKVKNVQVRHDGNAASHMHHKFAIVDGACLINGSFNWTRAAVRHGRTNLQALSFSSFILAGRPNPEL